MPRNEFMKESNILQTLTLPFRSVRVLIFAIIILFGSSFVLQTYFHKPELLTQELQLAQNIGITKSIAQSGNMKQEETKPPINIRITCHIYQALHWLFFDTLRLEQIAQNPKAYNIVQQFKGTLKVISMRLGNIAIYIFYAFLLSTIALIDGLNARKIRQSNAARESASLYHRAKYLRTGILWGSIFLYLTVPFSLSPQWLLIPVIGIAITVFIQAKYLKKYL